jgi:hypothetical protein
VGDERGIEPPVGDVDVGDLLDVPARRTGVDLGGPAGGPPA